MTIAACYLTPEGAVLGADSTSTFYFPDSKGTLTPHYFNYAQKIFEVGENSTLGMTMWGLGGLGLISYRTLIANLADDLASKNPTSVQDAAGRWTDIFWRAYSTAAATELKRVQDLLAKATRTPAEEAELQRLDGLGCGFCLAGYWPPDRTPRAFEVIFNLRMTQRPMPTELPLGAWRFWGAPNLVERVMFGIDSQLVQAIVSSPLWKGTEAELRAIAVQRYPVQDFALPLRDAIDFVHTCIYSTIKALKFSKLHQICGGPVEVAVISTDRRFRWVRHKVMGEAIDLERGRDAEAD